MLPLRLLRALPKLGIAIFFHDLAILLRISRIKVSFRVALQPCSQSLLELLSSGLIKPKLRSSYKPFYIKHNSSPSRRFILLFYEILSIAKYIIACIFVRLKRHIEREHARKCPEVVTHTTDLPVCIAADDDGHVNDKKKKQDHTLLHSEVFLFEREIIIREGRTCAITYWCLRKSSHPDLNRRTAT